MIQILPVLSRSPMEKCLVDPKELTFKYPPRPRNIKNQFYRTAVSLSKLSAGEGKSAGLKEGENYGKADPSYVCSLVYKGLSKKSQD